MGREYCEADAEFALWDVFRLHGFDGTSQSRRNAMKSLRLFLLSLGFLLGLATERLAQHYGGRRSGELKHPLQATHDLGVAQIWLQLQATATAWADAWRGEDILAHTRRGEKCPDAFIVNEQQEVFCVIEFGGAYSAQRVREFHEDCVERNLPYQLW